MHKKNNTITTITKEVINFNIEKVK